MMNADQDSGNVGRVAEPRFGVLRGAITMVTMKTGIRRSKPHARIPGISRMSRPRRDAVTMVTMVKTAPGAQASRPHTRHRKETKKTKNANIEFNRLFLGTEANKGNEEDKECEYRIQWSRSDGIHG